MASRMSAIPSAGVFVLREKKKKKIVGASSTKVKTHLSHLNKSDKESLHDLPPEGHPKSHGEQSGPNV